MFSALLVQWLFANQIRLKGATEAKYTNIVATHILLEPGGIKLSTLNSSAINLFLDKQLNQGGIKNGEALAPSYVRTMAVIIEAAINYGVMEGLCTPLRTPINKPTIPKKELIILSRIAEATLTETLMSRKGNCMDNGAMENFFGRLKVEMFYGEKFESVNAFIDELKKYIHYYNNERISLKLKGMSPVQYRTHSLTI